MKKFLITLIVIFTTIGFVSFVFILFNKVYFNSSFTIDSELASKFGSFFGGYVGTLFSILSVLLLIYSIIHQQIETRKGEIKSNFFKMIDYHNENVKQLSISHIEAEKKDANEGRRAFVIFKLQIKGLLEIVKDLNRIMNLDLKEKEIIDIAYIVFYYGLDRRWTPFVIEKLSMYHNHRQFVENLLQRIEVDPKLKLGRTNQTSLSAYFRNMYNAIKLVDNSKDLSKQEKQDLVKIYRAQLSNPELYVLFFNLVSRFGKKWIEKGFIMEYKLIKNIPRGYCDGFDPSNFFDIGYEHEEY